MLTGELETVRRRSFSGLLRRMTKQRMLAGSGARMGTLEHVLGEPAVEPGSAAFMDNVAEV